LKATLGAKIKDVIAITSAAAEHLFPSRDTSGVGQIF
jgi:hypothetical protein